MNLYITDNDRRMYVTRTSPNRTVSLQTDSTLWTQFTQLTPTEVMLRQWDATNERWTERRLADTPSHNARGIVQHKPEWIHNGVRGYVPDLMGVSRFGTVSGVRLMDNQVRFQPDNGTSPLEVGYTQIAPLTAARYPAGLTVRLIAATAAATGIVHGHVDFTLRTQWTACPIAAHTNGGCTHTFPLEMHRVA